MPLKTCTVDGKSGYQYGDQGKCYTGPGAKKKAIRQGVAIDGPKKFSEKAQEHETPFSQRDIETVVADMHKQGYNTRSIVATVSTLK